MRSYIPLLIISLLFGYEKESAVIQTEGLTSPINLAHALSLIDSLEIEGETIMFIWIYAGAPGYEPIAASGEGITCVDDVGRFMEVVETEILKYGNLDLVPLAAGMTKFLLYLSREDGLWHNFMYADGNINTTHKNSVAEFGWWAIRGLRGLAAAYNIFSNNAEYSTLLEQVEGRIVAAGVPMQAIIGRYPVQELTSLGSKPAWLVKNAPDMNSELLIALTKLHNTGKFDYLDEIRKISEGLVEYQYQVPEHDLNGMYFCWDDVWHNWGNNQALGLLEAYKITADSTLLISAENWADSFVPFLVENNFPWEIKVSNSQEYTLTAEHQIAYGMNSIYRGLKSLAEVVGNDEYIRLSEQVFEWYQGQNVAQTPMYDPLTGRCFDGIDSTNTVNLNSGAESTIECLMAIQMRGDY